MKRPLLLLPVLLISYLILVLPGCSLGSNYIKKGESFKPTAEKNAIYTLYLIGDAGKTLSDDPEPALISLSSEILKSNPDSTLVVFLGDNIYDHGLPDENHPDRSKAENYIKDQINALGANHRALFIAGNHDWDNNSPMGNKLMKNQELFIRKYSSARAQLLPENGCQGPDFLDINENLRLIYFDSQRLFRDWLDIPDSSECKPIDLNSFFNNLELILKNSNGRKCILLHHHPFITYGEHGGKFDWKKHIFPLTAFNKYFLLPLPVVGSLYPILRSNGITPQDMSNDVYGNYTAKMREISKKYNPVFSASGHEHSLQVIRDPVSNTIQIISGKGTRLTDGTVSTGEGTIFASPFSGFMKYEIYADGTSLLTVIVPDDEGKAAEVFYFPL
ncbi:MAG: metallophosphoesterase [Ignavibacteriales bacterium]|nr:metallophosphoesterase [Ignavibacteriales bacterium]MBP9122472.1 metallophosphoesterase [Ignavibacteriaceae bacterium]